MTAMSRRPWLFVQWPFRSERGSLSPSQVQAPAVALCPGGASVPGVAPPSFAFLDIPTGLSTRAQVIKLRQYIQVRHLKLNFCPNCVFQIGKQKHAGTHVPSCPPSFVFLSVSTVCAIFRLLFFIFKMETEPKYLPRLPRGSPRS